MFGVSYPPAAHMIVNQLMFCSSVKVDPPLEKDFLPLTDDHFEPCWNEKKKFEHWENEMGTIIDKLNHS